MKIINIRFALANVKSHIEEKADDANVQAHSRWKLAETDMKISQQRW